MTKRFLTGMFMLMVGLAFVQCSKPDESLSLEESDLIAAKYDETADFGSFTTFYLADSVRELNKDGEWVWSDDDIDYIMRDQVIAKMTERGYTQITDKADKEDADLGLQISKISTLTIGTGWTPCYYPPGWGYWPCYGCGGGWYYPWGCSYTYSYKTGSVFIEMIDVQNPIEDEGELKYRVNWISGMNGILSSSTSTDAERVIRGINIAFDDLSPYLTNK